MYKLQVIDGKLVWVEYVEVPIPDRPSLESCPECGKEAILMTVTKVENLEIDFKKISGTLGESKRMCPACYIDHRWSKYI